ncbi:kinase-like domain-containing protein [Nemania abortiva]|nr:kinase-like domain-containing protein [Nemania abortiva]
MAQSLTSSEVQPGDWYLGFGISGEVVQRGDLAIKRPMRYDVSNLSPSRRNELEYFMESAASTIRDEKKIYHHLGRHNRIITAWYDLESEDPIITMPCMTNGSLQDYLLRNKPAEDLQTAWARAFAEAVAYCHKKNVLIADIGSRNCLLDADFSLKLCDFGISVIIDPDINIAEANYNGVTVRTDIAQFGVVLYEICTGEVLNHGGRRGPHFEEIISEDGCDSNSENGGDANLQSGWPEINNLPSTEGIRFGEIIRKCWTKTYWCIEQVVTDLAQLPSVHLEP